MSENLTEKMIQLISPWVTPMGYEIVHLEVDLRQKILRLFIDHLDRSDGISIEDCVKVTRTLDEPLDKLPEVDKAFGGAGYELEVSSPGIDRPLRNEQDYEKFKGREVRIHTFRSLNGEEMGNADYQAKNPKQKNFLGTLRGFRDGRVLLALNLTGGHDKTQKKPGPKGVGKSKAAKTAAESPTNSAEVAIPLPLIAKANLEPDFEVLEGTG